ncbi:MAG: DUF1097 domain-containing protein [Deltaproteobacteria bacterium]|nr:DUF1097 domain-containing protein [Deltaproteobacteria bacterium]
MKYNLRKDRRHESIISNFRCGRYYSLLFYSTHNLGSLVVAWPAFAGWACFFFCGGQIKDAPKSYICSLSGAIHSAVILFIWSQLTNSNVAVLPLFILVLGFTLTIEGATKLLSSIPAQFLGAAVYFGNMSGKGLWEALFHTAIMLLLGNIIGIISIVVPPLFQKKTAPQS